MAYYLFDRKASETDTGAYLCTRGGWAHIKPAKHLCYRTFDAAKVACDDWNRLLRFAGDVMVRCWDTDAEVGSETKPETETQPETWIAISREGGVSLFPSFEEAKVYAENRISQAPWFFAKVTHKLTPKYVLEEV